MRYPYGFRARRAVFFNGKGIDIKAELDEVISGMKFIPSGFSTGFPSASKEFNLRTARLMGGIEPPGMIGKSDGITRTILDSVLVDEVYYAAVRESHDNNVYAYVFPTDIDKIYPGIYWYKDMDEAMLPDEQKCPMSIITLLTPTNDENSIAWRQGCCDYAEISAIGQSNEGV